MDRDKATIVFGTTGCVTFLLVIAAALGVAIGIVIALARLIGGV